MKLRYKGVMNGFFRFSNGGEFPVTKGQTYDVPDQFVDAEVKSGSWEKIQTAVKEEKKVNRTYNKNSTNKMEE